MPQEIARQTTFNGGELDPRLHGRQDVKPYFAMVELGENVVPTSVGPMARRPGTSFVDYARHKLTSIDFNVDMMTAPNGGDLEDLLTEGELFATAPNLGAANHLLLTIDFGVPVRIAAVDVVDYHVGPTPTDDAPPPTPPPFVYPYPHPIFDGSFGVIRIENLL